MKWELSIATWNVYAFVDLFHSWEKNEDANQKKIGHKFYKKVQGPRNWKISTKL